MTTPRPRQSGNLAVWLGLAITLIGVIWAAATGLQSRFDTLDKRQVVIEQKLDTFMNAFNVHYEPKTPAAANGGGTQ